MRRALGPWLALATSAALVGLVVAPQLVLGADALLAPWAPPLVARAVGHLVFELGLWGAGVAAFAAGRRLGVRLGAVATALLLAAPALAEGALLLALERWSGQLSSGLGVACRLAVGAVAIVFALRCRRPPAQSIPASAATRRTSS